MLRFTQEQGLAVNRSRAAFNRAMQAMAANHSDIVGNASQIPLDAWRRIDQQAVLVQRDELVIFNRLAQASSTPIAIGDLVNYFPKISDSGEVHVSMDGRSEGKADQALIKYEGTPVPIIDSQARFGWRQMEVMRKTPAGIDVQTVANDQRKVAEKAEDMILNGLSSIVVGSSTIYGLRTFPQRATGVHGLTLNGATGAQWLAMFQAMLAKLIAMNAYGKVTVFLNYADWFYASVNEFTAGYPKTILQRLQEVAQVAEIVPATRVATDEVFGIADIGTGKWGTVLNAMPLTTRPKARHNPEDDYTVGVLMAVAPQFRSDYDGRSQIVQYTKA